MAKSRFEFIKELLEDKRINPNQREKILELASKELGENENLEPRVRKIEETLAKSNRVSNSKQYIETTELFGKENPVEDSIDKETKENLLPKYQDPFLTYQFLFQFNQNKVLRSTCHDLSMSDLEQINEYCNTSEYNFKNHLDKIIEAFKLHEDEYYGGGKLNALIRSYLTGKDFKGNENTNGWSTDKIMVNWSSPELIAWTKNNPGIPPNLNSTELSNLEVEPFSVHKRIDSVITDLPVQSFTELTLHFKNLFHIKSGPQSLREILKRVNIAKNWNDSIDFEIELESFPSNIEHFTDIDKLIQAYNKLIQLLLEKNRANHRPKVKLSFNETKNAVVLSMHHLNGQFSKSIENTLNRTGNGLATLINSQINSLCNLRLRADFGTHGYAEINLWDGKKREAINLDAFQGVEHILEFPKTKKS